MAMSPTECVGSRKTEVNGEVYGGRPRPTGAVVPREKKLMANALSIFTSFDTTVSYKNIQMHIIYIKTLKTALFDRHLQVYCLCLDAEFVFLIWVHILNMTIIACNVMLGNKTLGIFYFLVQLSWY
jgi:hypothetical protein